MEIKSKNDIIDYFASGIKQDELIGVENEQFLFNIKTNKRAEYENIKKLLQIFITKFGWQEIREKEKQRVKSIFLSSLFKRNKNHLGINKFKIQARLTLSLIHI